MHFSSRVLNAKWTLFQIVCSLCLRNMTCIVLMNAETLKNGLDNKNKPFKTVQFSTKFTLDLSSNKWLLPFLWSLSITTMLHVIQDFFSKTWMIINVCVCMNTYQFWCVYKEMNWYGILLKFLHTKYTWRLAII